jgi:inhibitor of KinA sporulation pathway (predicted exonuclease)
MKIAVVDVESTCWNTPEEMAKNVNEVIEIGWSILDNDKTTSSGHWYIKPTHSKVSTFCQNLTGISQEQLDKNGISAKEAYSKLNALFSSVDAWASYGNYDKIMFTKMETMNQVKINMPAKHFNVRELFAKKILNKVDPKEAPSNPKISMEKIGLTFVGNNHSGIDDAKNIGLLLIKLNGEKNEKL